MCVMRKKKSRRGQRKIESETFLHDVISVYCENK